MNAEDSKSVIQNIANLWPRPPMNDGAIEVWSETLADLNAAYARSALRALKEVNDFQPSHAELIRAYGIAKRKADEAHQQQMLNQTGGSSCDCDNGWIEIDTTGHGTVKRCPRCNGPRQADHKASCSCGLCRYGEVRWAQIQAGRDGLGPKRDRELRIVDVEPVPSFYEPSEEF